MIACFGIAFEPGFGHGLEACLGIAILASVMTHTQPPCVVRKVRKVTNNER
jgi:hypothetical protein